jgi:hypothetical protein
VIHFDEENKINVEISPCLFMDGGIGKREIENVKGKNETRSMSNQIKRNLVNNTMNISAGRGLTELVGEPGAGKTKLALWDKRGAVRTLYIAIDSSGISSLPPTVLFVKIKNIFQLKVYMAKEIKKIVKEKSIERLVLDSLESFLCTEESPRKESGSIFRIVETLRYLCFVLGVDVYVINSSYGCWNNDGVRIANRYIGLPWEYMVNNRYLVERHSDYRTVRRVSAKCYITEKVDENECGNIHALIGKDPVKFKITDYGIEFILQE